MTQIQCCSKYLGYATTVSFPPISLNLNLSLVFTTELTGYYSIPMFCQARLNRDGRCLEQPYLALLLTAQPCTMRMYQLTVAQQCCFAGTIPCGSVGHTQANRATAFQFSREKNIVGEAEVGLVGGWLENMATGRKKTCTKTAAHLTLTSMILCHPYYYVFKYCK